MGVCTLQDPVPRVPKSTYKRCGSRVIINGRGDIIVRPTFLESSVLKGSKWGAAVGRTPSLHGEAAGRPHVFSDISA